MKPIRIDFVEPQAWKLIWIVAAVVTLTIFSVYGAKLWDVEQQRKELEQQLASLNIQEQQSSRNTNSEPSTQNNPRAGSEAIAERLLQWDWNRLYDAIETPALSNVKLVQMSFDAQSGQATLEFELEQMTQAAKVTDALIQTSQPNMTWRLERLQSNAQASAVSGSDTRIQGVWLGMVSF